MKLTFHYRLARFIFWFAQVLAIVTSSFLIVFTGGNLIGELVNKLIDFKEDYSVFLFFFWELLIAGSIILSWYRRRFGPTLMIAFTVLILIFWGREDINIILLHLPLLFSALLLLFYSYYKEWILKKKA